MSAEAGSSGTVPQRVPVTLPLGFQQEIFQSVQENDELVILAKGLGLLRIVTNFLHTYDATGNSLVILVGAHEREIIWIEEAMAQQGQLLNSRESSKGSGKAAGLKVITSEAWSVGARRAAYRKGGVFAITSRILIGDLLTEDMLRPETITGLVLLHAERTSVRSQEAFIIRLFRSNNKEGFIKAFSDDPIPFTRGYNQLAKTMRDLFLKRAAIWPRFHVAVKDSLEAKRPEVVEFEVALSDNMKDIQDAILECIEATMSQLRAANRDALEMEDWNIDSALNGNFDELVRSRLAPYMHSISWKSRQMVEDLSTLRRMLESLLHNDAVSFHWLVELIREANEKIPGKRHDPSPWLLMDAANTIIELAKRRAYSGDFKASEVEEGLLPDTIHPTLEEQPKWQILQELLDEIEREQYLNPQPKGTSNNTILIMCSSTRIVKQLQELLGLINSNVYKGSFGAQKRDTTVTPGKRFLTRKLYEFFIASKKAAEFKKNFYAERQSSEYGPMNREHSHNKGYNANSRAPPNKRRRVRGGAAVAGGPSRAAKEKEKADEYKPVEVKEMFESIRAGEGTKDDPITIEEMADAFELLDLDDLVVVHAYDKENDERLLEEIKPRYIILYQPDPAFVRRVEVYRSSHNQRNLKVYFMHYSNSVEEKQYLTSIRREKDAFTKLIRDKGNMTVTLTASQQIDQDEAVLRVVNTRIAGGGLLSATTERPTIIFDHRELRSHLPALLHTKFKIIPSNLTVGDYALAPHIVVERKSIPDLIQSLKSGRLFNQCQQMFAHYERACLLIEMEGANPSLDPYADMESRNTQQELFQTKLALLTLAYPQLQIIWSTSPSHTADIFAMLKEGHKEPDPKVAAGLGTADDGELGQGRRYNPVPMEMLEHVMGVEVGDTFKLAEVFADMREVAAASETKLVKALGSAPRGREAWRFFNRKNV